MNLEGMDRYAAHRAYRDGMIFTLDDAPQHQFLVILPGPHNRAYVTAVSAELDKERNLIDDFIVNESLFLDHCLIRVNNEPVPENFHLDYPEAVKELMNKAHAESEKIQAEAAEAEKKSSLTSVGTKAGEAA